MGSEDQKQTPRDPAKNPPTQSANGPIFSPRFISVAAMAGWDEDSLLCASLIVDDTPERESRHRKRRESQFKTPPSSNSRKKRRAQQRSPILVPMVALDLDDGETAKKEATPLKEDRKKSGGDSLGEQNSGVSSSSSTSLPCMDKLREELSCAICLDICFEPSTTPCGHSFCLKCLRSAASKCGKKCPKCRQLISNGRSCTVNTVLWNTIQLLFPKEVEAKESAGASKAQETEHRKKIPEAAFYDSLRNEGTRESPLPSRAETGRRRRATTQSQNEDSILGSEREMRRIIRAASRVSSRDSMSIPSQDEDAALALRLQREEFLGSVRETTTLNRSRTSSNTGTSSRGARVNQSSTSTSTSSISRTTVNQNSGDGGGGGSRTSSLSLARANLRAMASRAITLSVRGRYNI